MTNEYYTHSTPLARNTLARASEVNAKLDAIEAGFDKLPAPQKLVEDRVNYVTLGGSANAYTASLNASIVSLTEGLRIHAKVPDGLGNTGASTINVNAIGAVAIKRPNGEDLQANDMPGLGIVDLTYNGTDFRLPASVSIAVAGEASIADGAVTTGKLASAALKALAVLTPAADRIAYFTNATTAALATLTSFGRSLIAAVDAAAARVVLELGSLATKNTVNNSDWSGADLAITNGGTGASSESAMRTAFSLYSKAEVDTAILNIPIPIVIACSNETSDLSTGSAKVTFRMVRAIWLIGARASVTEAPTGAAIQVDINANGSSIFSTPLTIDAGEKTSETADTPLAFAASSIADDAEVTIDIDQVGSSNPGKGLKVTIYGKRVT